MYDEDLGSRLYFKEEVRVCASFRRFRLSNRFGNQIGFGNWGSVWLCIPYLTPATGTTPGTQSDVKVATKLVHRSKTATTKARVQSL